ncbi:EVI5-like protein [Platysternon megacephalum]|uniref:EVI5-like protein n=1 Tax=Platysternon megacephalum TaxID=55544 RepID=A0A4D9DHR9_9SAUR|nr:EVI5-like protein [Platysternon megacephalum]
MSVSQASLLRCWLDPGLLLSNIGAGEQLVSAEDCYLFLLCPGMIYRLTPVVQDLFDPSQMLVLNASSTFARQAGRPQLVNGVKEKGVGELVRVGATGGGYI